MANMSRTDLVAWLNELLQINYTKVEQCGSGAAYCQVIDSIYGDVPMGKVKMNSKAEYEHLTNYKVLQNTFKAHGIDKPLPVDRLVKCKMQDNLEFLQWLKKYWDMNFPGGEYDPVARRKGGAIEAPRTAGRSPITAPVRSAGASTSAAGGAAARRTVPGARALSRGSGASAGGVPDAALQQLTAQMNEMKVSVEGLEKERDFYFNKLREVEIIIGARLESNDETMTEVEKEQLLRIQEILYSTEDGFEVPEDGEEVYEEGDVEETF